MNYEWWEPIVVVPGSSVLTIGEGSRVDSFTKIETGLGVTIGRGVHISSFVHLNIGGGELIVGDYCAIASGAKILGGSNTSQGMSMSSAAPKHMQVVTRKKTVIGDYAFIGSGAIIMPGVTVGPRAIIGAGAVVIADVPAGEVWVASPARKFSSRS